MAFKLTDFGGKGDGATDNTAAFNQAVSVVLSATSTRTLEIPRGDYWFMSAPAPIAGSVNLVGEGKGVSRLFKNYSGAPNYFLRFTQGSDEYGGPSIRHLGVMATLASTDGIAVWVTAMPDTGDLTLLSKNPHGMLIDDVMLGRRTTAGGGWAFGIYLDGYNNPGPGAVGIRAVTVRNTMVNFATIASFYLYNAHGCRFDEVDSYGTPTYSLGIDGGSQNTDIWTNTVTSPTIINGSSNVRLNGVVIA